MPVVLGAGRVRAARGLIGLRTRLLNGTQGMLALLSLALRDADILADTADVAAIILFAGSFASWTVKTRGQEFYALLLLLVTEIGLVIKRRSPLPQTFTVSLANGYNGYLPTPQQHRWGGYETWLGTNVVQEDTSVILTKHLLEMLAELHGAK